MRDGCVFCGYEGPSKILRVWGDEEGVPAAFAIEPLNPVVPGHVIVVPFEHVEDFRSDLDLFAEVAGCAGEFARRRGDCNLIVSSGAAATQSVMHLHVHVVPRRAGDGLRLPWSP